MPYYFFNRCEESCVSELERISKELGLNEYPSVVNERRYWSGLVLSAKNNFDKELIIQYDPASHFPLMIQTNTNEHHKKDVKKLIKSLIEICRPSEIYKDPFRQTKYDLSDFED
jgi:hypothetical protein